MHCFTNCFRLLISHLSPATKKTEPSKPMAASGPIPAAKRPLPLKAEESKAAEAKAAEAKPTRTKILESSKALAAKKTASPGPRAAANNRLPLGRKPPALPANKSAASKEQERLDSSTAVVATVAGVVAAAAVSSVAESTETPVTAQGEVEAASPEVPSLATSGAEKIPSEASAQDSPLVSQQPTHACPTAPEGHLQTRLNPLTISQHTKYRKPYSSYSRSRPVNI